MKRRCWRPRPWQRFTAGQIVEGGVLGNELIIEATCDKFIDHLPLERQCSHWAQAGVHISPATLGRSVAAHIDLLKLLSEAIVEQTRGPGYLATDATGIPILDPTTDAGLRNGSIWCWTNAYWVAFFYSSQGNADCVDRFLGGNRKRIVQSDGTSIMNRVEKAGGQRPGCWCHGRRGFVLAAQRKERRQSYSAPVVEEIRISLEEQRGLIPPKTPFGKALGYLH